MKFANIVFRVSTFIGILIPSLILLKMAGGIVKVMDKGIGAIVFFSIMLAIAAAPAIITGFVYKFFLTSKSLDKYSESERNTIALWGYIFGMAAWLYLNYLIYTTIDALSSLGYLFYGIPVLVVLVAGCLLGMFICFILRGFKFA